MAWERLAHVALSGSGDVLDSGTFTAKKNMRVIIQTIATGGNIKENITFNSDTGNNYSRRRSNDGASDSTDTSQAQLEVRGDEANDRYLILNIFNKSGEEKLVIGEYNINTAGAGNAPSRCEWVGKYATKTGQITKIVCTNTGSGSYAAGSYITVLGAKEAATADVITVDSLAAKKHLMIHAKVITTGGAVSQRMTFNNDTGSNYAQRRQADGASDSPGTSKSSIDGLNDDLVTDSVGFTTYFIINEAAKEKLVIAEAVSGEAAGAGNAPTRDECVFKWANTSNAITRVDINNNKAGSYAEGSEVTVYGTD